MNFQPTFNAAELSAFVQSKGWVQVAEAVQDGLYVFNHPDFAPLQLVFAANESFQDSKETLVRATSRLAQAYEWSLPETIRFVEETNHDVVVSRIPDENRKRSTVPFLYALQVLAGQKELMLSGAAAEGQRQAYYSSTFVGNGRRMLEAARFRHTEEGSFVFKASCSVFAFEGEGNVPLFSPQEVPIATPFVRRAMLNIETGLRDLVSSIRGRQEDRLIEDVKQRASSPVSANFCDAVGELRDREHPRPVELSISWSPLLLPPPTISRDPIIILPDDFPIIESIGKELQPSRKPVHDTYVGTVEKLSGVFNEKGQREGNVLLSLNAEKPESERVKVWTTLSAPEYDAAMEVHRTMKVVVRVSGTIRPSSRQPYKFDLDRFEIMNVVRTPKDED